MTPISNFFIFPKKISNWLLIILLTIYYFPVYIIARLYNVEKCYRMLSKIIIQSGILPLASASEVSHSSCHPYAIKREKVQVVAHALEFVVVFNL